MAFGQGRNRNKGVGRAKRCEFRKRHRMTYRRRGRAGSLLTSMEYVPREEEKIGSAVQFNFEPVFRCLALVQIEFMYFIVAVMLSK